MLHDCSVHCDNNILGQFRALCACVARSNEEPLIAMRQLQLKALSVGIDW